MTPLCRLVAGSVERAAVSGRPLPPGSWLAGHLSRCESCRSLFERHRRAYENLHYLWETPRPSGRFMAEVWDRATAGDIPARRLLAVPRTVRAAALGAAVLLVIAAGRAYFHGIGTPGGASRSGSDHAGVMLSGAGDRRGAAGPERTAKGKPGGSRSVAETAEQSPLMTAPERGVLAVRGAEAGGREAGSGDGRPGRREAQRGAPVSDDRYLNGENGSLLDRWVTGHEPLRLPPGLRLSRVRDDFVEVPLSRLADARGNRAAIAAAREEYEKQAQIVDSRLFRKVTVQAKAAPLEELTAELEKQTGVHLHAARSVADEKVTVFVREIPVRDLMRAVARLLGFIWTRSGPEEAYEYELSQSLKARLQEEELRNADVNAALLALDEEMAAYRPLLNQPIEQLRARIPRAPEPEKQRLQELVERGGWGAARLYLSLSPEDRLALAAGQQLTFSAGAENPNRSLPREWAENILNSETKLFTIGVGEPSREGEGLRLAQYGGASPASISLKIERKEMDVFTLQSRTVVTIPVRGELAPGHPVEIQHPYHIWNTLAEGRSASGTDPENARVNAALRNDRAFIPVVSLLPKAAPRIAVKLPDYARDPNDGPRLTTAEFWEAVYRETGKPVVADYYTRIYPVPFATVEKGTRFEALCRAGDRLRLRWTQDGSFLMGRSTSFFWDKIKEVSKRELERWSSDRLKTGGLPVEEFLEMATHSDLQLDSRSAGEGLAYLWGLEDWRILSGGTVHPWTGSPMVRTYARFVAGLSPDQRARALSPAGLAWTSLRAPQQQALLQLLPAEAVAGTEPDLFRSLRLRAVFAPAGWCAWAEHNGAPPRGAAPTGPGALADALARLPGAGPDHVALTSGNFAVFIGIEDRFRSEYHGHRWGTGGQWGGRSY